MLITNLMAILCRDEILAGLRRQQIMSRASESPLEKMFRRRPSFKRPPIRDVHSPRLTDDEADQLTSPFLNYSTGYTYAFSQSYNPDKPPAWEVPNINNNFLHISNQEYTQHAAPSIMCRLKHAGSSAFWTVVHLVSWALYTITLRPVKLLGLFLYDAFVGMVYLTRCVGESITDCVYEQIGNYRRSFRRRSFLEIVTMTFLKLVYALASVLRYPVELICRVFRAVNLTLTRRYYEVLAANGRRLNNQAMIKKLRAANKATDLYNHWMLLRKAEQESAQRYEWSGDKYDPNDPNDPDTRFYNLRSRNIASFDTDSEDDEIPKRRKTVRFDTVPSEVVPDNSEFRKMSMAYRIATWLGSTASSVVYYLLYVAHLVVLCVKTPYNFVVGKDDSNYTTPSNSKEEVVLVGRHPRRRMIAGSDDSYDEFNQNLFVGPEPSPVLSRITSFCSTVLYAPCRAFLFLAFAVVDLIRWLHSRTKNVFLWLWENSSSLVGTLFNRRRRWLWWLLPLFLLLLVLLSRQNNDDPFTTLGQRVSEMQDKLTNYAFSFVDSEGVYAKSINSIYDEYWRNGKIGNYGLLTRVSAAASNAWLFVVTIIKTICGLFTAIVTDAVSYVLDFLATTCHLAYSKLPSMPSLNMPSVERTNWSTLYTASTTQMAKYLPSAPNVSSWKSSAVDIATNAEKSFYNFVWSLKAVGASAIAVSQQILLTLFRLIAYPFHLLCDSVPENQGQGVDGRGGGSSKGVIFLDHICAHVIPLLPITRSRVKVVLWNLPSCAFPPNYSSLCSMGKIQRGNHTSDVFSIKAAFFYVFLSTNSNQKGGQLRRNEAHRLKAQTFY
ncbi:hypothetical protein Y032_0223g2675 [Ancylostoma ceylanicum]|uniref:Uncharacterized protein n=3 Tax=Ancylostoma ceylanicum TaxID=53326 RepID=A0A016SHS0_9BILA|nr:hypothetical protein Y032_0223g2675 [Ancylostoma ceylanicum]